MKIYIKTIKYYHSKRNLLSIYKQNRFNLIYGCNTFMLLIFVYCYEWFCGSVVGDYVNDGKTHYFLVRNDKSLC